jgi:Rrf2 family iron-sulfur cluster assembly transcriptional regulator
MKFSSQEEFGVRCLLQIVKHGSSQKGMTIPEISQAEGLSEANTAKLLRILRMGGFIDSSRGQEGGYHLTRPANAILISDVLAVLGGKLFDDKFCDKHSGFEDTCYHSTDCSIRHLWQTVQTRIDDVLSGITLQDLVSPVSLTPTQISWPSVSPLHH